MCPLQGEYAVTTLKCILGWLRRIRPATDTFKRLTFAQRAVYLFSNIFVGLQRSLGQITMLGFVDTDVENPEPPKKRAKKSILRYPGSSENLFLEVQK